jgi:tetratricopeptide (TPR) repeat protein
MNDPSKEVSRLNDLLDALSCLEKGEPAKAMVICNNLMVDRSTGRVTDLYIEWAALNIGTVAARNSGEWQMRTKFEIASANPELYNKELLSKHPEMTKRIVELMRLYIESNFTNINPQALERTNAGAELAMKGQIDEAGRLLQQAVALDSHCELAQFNLGVYAHSIGDRALAIASMENVLKINPMNEPARRAIRMLGETDGGRSCGSPSSDVVS